MLIFNHFWANGGPSAHPCGTFAQSCLNKKLHMTFEDMVKLFLFITFIAKFNILATRGKKSCFFYHFWHISAILDDFLTRKEKINKMKKLRIVDTYLECGLRFFHFQSGRASKWPLKTFKMSKKMTKKIGKNSVHV